MVERRAQVIEGDLCIAAMVAPCSAFGLLYGDNPCAVLWLWSSQPALDEQCRACNGSCAVVREPLCMSQWTCEDVRGFLMAGLSVPCLGLER